MWRRACGDRSAAGAGRALENASEGEVVPAVEVFACGGRTALQERALPLKQSTSLQFPW